MLYSASRRTDMVAFFPDAIVDKVSRSRRLEGIVFWTKDIRNLVRHSGLARIVRTIPAIIQYTVTGLSGGEWEPRVPTLEEQLSDLDALSALLPKGAIRWRFDPIIPESSLFERFKTVKNRLESVLGPLDAVTVSFPDPYRHAVPRASAAGLPWPRPNLEEKKRIITGMSVEFPGVSEPVRLCCEPDLLILPGVGMARCIDGALFESLYGLPLGGLAKDGGQRVACGCVKSTDIGSYAMRCPHRCLYCYANPEV